MLFRSKKIIPEDNIILLDVKLEDSIRAAVHVLKTKLERLDLIINNAGIIGNRAGLNKVEMDDHIETFMTNAIGPLFVTKYCLPLLGKDSTIVNISSLMGSIDDTSGGSYSYRISKAALNMVTKNPQEDLKGKGISVVSIHPGWVRTRLATAVAPVSTKRSISGMLKEIGRASCRERV